MGADFLIETCLVFLFNMIRIIKDPRCIVERDTMFREIFCRFAWISFEGHIYIMRVTRRYGNLFVWNDVLHTRSEGSMAYPWVEV
jgi:hypothetical protein